MTTSKIQPTKKQRFSLRETLTRPLHRFFSTALAVSVIFFTVRTFIGYPIQVASGSMEPTYWAPTIQIVSSLPQEVGGFWTSLFHWIWTGTISLQLTPSIQSPHLQFTPHRWLSTLLQPFGLAAYQIQSKGKTQTVLIPRFAVPLLLRALSSSSTHSTSFQIHAGDWVWLDRFTYHFRFPRRFEVVAIRNKGPYASYIPTSIFLKRIVALPQERIRIRDDGRLEINDRPIPFPKNLQNNPNFHGYLNQKHAQTLGLRVSLPLTPNAAVEHFVHPHSYFVLGDASAISLDSRVFGDVRAERIVGRVLFRLWPFQHVSTMGISRIRGPGDPPHLNANANQAYYPHPRRPPYPEWETIVASAWNRH